MTLEVSLDQARAFWYRRQGLAEPSPDLVAALASTGWARTLGGVDVYFGVRARCTASTRSALDDAVADGAVRVVPAVRGCIYLVPEADVPLVMALAADLSRPRTDKELDKVGVTRDEVETLAGQVLDVLAAGPLTTQAIRKHLPDGAVRGLGEIGKKLGISSPLPAALRELELRGEITRCAVGRRLDTEHYEWSRPAVPLREKYPVPDDRTALLAAVVRRFFQFFGPATRKELASWVGITQRDAKDAMAVLPLVPVTIQGEGAPSEEAWILEDDRDELAAVRPTQGSVSFLPFEDNLLTVHGGPGVLTDPAFHAIPVETWGRGKPTILGTANHLSMRPLVLDGHLAGFWEVDLDTGEIVVGTFEKIPKTHVESLDQQRHRLAAFVRDELGHARSFSLDTDEAVRRRAGAIREMG